MRCVIAFLLLAKLLVDPACSLAQQYPFVHYTPKDGLVSARARQMIQDSKGRLYIATAGGLSIFDGARFTNYTIENGLAANVVNDVVEMGDDSVWIMPNLNKIHYLLRGKLKDFVPADGFSPTINKLIKASHNSYYALADEGLFQLENNRFKKIILKDDNGKDLNRYLIKGCKIDDKILMVTDPTIGEYPAPSHLVVHDLKTGKTIVSKKPPEVYDVIESPQKDILVCTNKGLKAVDKLALLQGEIVFSDPPSTYQAAMEKGASYIYFDRQHNLWLNSAEGILKVDQQGRDRLYTVENGLTVNRHYSVFQDHENIMWFVNEQTGISKLSNTQFEFYPQIIPGFDASDLYTDSKTDSVWFVDYLQKRLFIRYPNGSKEYTIRNSSDWIFRFIPGENRNFLTGYFELYQFDKNVENEIRPRLIRTYRDSLQGVPTVNFPLPDGYGNLLYSNYSINVALPNSKIVSNSLGYFGDQFVTTPDRYLWITSRAKKLLLYRINPDDPDHYFQLIKVYDSIIPNGPRSIALDKSGNLWIGTRDLGLFCFAVDEKFDLTLKHQITSSSGLSDNCILYLHGDQQGTIWACSPVGLDKVQLKNKKWVVDNITLGNNIYQNVIKVNSNKRGELWILTSSGIIKIRSTPEFKPKNFRANILFTEVRAGRDTLDILADNSGISYKKNDFLFKWAVPTFMDEKQTRFRYWLEGSNTNDWSDPSTEAMIRFINLPPGKYTFHIKANFPNGLYPDTETMFPFEILPTWWQTWWFNALVILTTVGIAALIFRSYVRKKLEHQRHILEKRQAVEKERRRIASDMHDDLGAGLTSIRFLSEKVKQSAATDIAKKEIGRIANISGELFENMNEIIWAMSEKSDTLEDLLLYSRSYAKEYCEENKLDCLDDFPETIPSIFVSGEVRRNIFLTIKECLHNVVKHSGATVVQLQISVTDQLIVTIQDNGKGLPLPDLDHHSGGNGMMNMQRRIESIGGEFVVKNGTGLTVMMKVPLQKL